jgi:hypothetical protein
MSTTTNLILSAVLTTEIVLLDSYGNSQTPVGEIETSLKINQTKEIQLINTGLIGPRGQEGQRGQKGEPGPEYTGDDLPDFTLIFENKLI